MSTLLAVMGVAGCGLRFESPAPAALVVDADEISRQAMVADIVAIREAAVEARAPLPPEDVAAPALDRVLLFADEHLTVLGGEYVSGDDTGAADGDGELPADAHTPLEPGTVTDDDGQLDPSVTATPAPDVAAPGPATAATVVELLTQSSARARGSLTTPLDGGLARLYASIATSQLETARDLAAAVGAPFAVPENFAFEEPATLPLEVGATDLQTLVRSEDAAGYASEVVAARTADDRRALALDRADTHRDRAQAWAELASLDGTAKDPRRVAYQLPGGTTAVSSPESSAALLLGIEDTLTATYATLVGQVDAPSRASMLDLLAESHRAARAWGAPLVAFPGLPERAEPEEEAQQEETTQG